MVLGWRRGSGVCCGSGCCWDGVGCGGVSRAPRQEKLLGTGRGVWLHWQWGWGSSCPPGMDPDFFLWACAGPAVSCESCCDPPAGDPRCCPGMEPPPRLALLGLWCWFPVTVTRGTSWGGGCSPWGSAVSPYPVVWGQSSPGSCAVCLSGPTGMWPGGLRGGRKMGGSPGPHAGGVSAAPHGTAPVCPSASLLQTLVVVWVWDLTVPLPSWLRWAPLPPERPAGGPRSGCDVTPKQPQFIQTPRINIYALMQCSSKYKALSGISFKH